jgi:hypothetical protein
MAFDDFELRMSPATSDDVLAVLLEHHRQCCFKLEWCKRPVLSRSSTIREYDASCDCDNFPLSAVYLNRIFGLSFSQAEWKRLCSPAGKKTLGELCDAIAPHVTMPRIEPVTVFGSTSASAGAFLVIRKLFASAGADASAITPSTPIEPFLRDHPEVYSKLGYLAPGRVPVPRVVSPTHTGLGWMFLLGKLMAIGGMVLRQPTLKLVGWLNVGVAFVAALIVGQQIKPSRIQLGWLQTFRDLSRAMVGEQWGAWRGFAMD